MDEYLRSRLMQPDAQSGATTVEHTIEIIDDASGEVGLPGGGDAKVGERYVLKPLAELFGRGLNKTVDPLDPAFEPLFMSIEQEFTRLDRTAACREDNDVLVALDLLAMAPEGDMSHNALARRVQMSLRLLLSLNDHSRDEVRQALRKIRKSVERRHREGGRRGYLSFIRNYV